MNYEKSNGKYWRNLTDSERREHEIDHPKIGDNPNCWICAQFNQDFQYMEDGI